MFAAKFFGDTNNNSLTVHKIIISDIDTFVSRFGIMIYDPIRPANEICFLRDKQIYLYYKDLCLSEVEIPRSPTPPRCQ